MDDMIRLRSALKAAGGTELVPTVNDLVVKSLALALAEFPRANGSYRDGAFELHHRVNVGIADAAVDTLVVPTIFDADRKSVFEIAAARRQAADRVRAGAITPPELSGGTFTVSNLGMLGIDEFIAVVNPLQAAILAVGAIRGTPADGVDGVVFRTTVRLSLFCDHRTYTGADAAQFLARIRESFKDPGRL